MHCKGPFRVLPVGETHLRHVSSQSGSMEETGGSRGHRAHVDRSPRHREARGTAHG